MRSTDDYQASYVRNYGFEQVIVRYRRRKVLEVLFDWKPRRLLEVGCALESLFPHAGSFDRFVIVEPCSEFAERARSLATGDDRIRVVETTLEDAGNLLEEESFDVIVASSVFHEVPNQKQFLEALRRAGQPG